jgi:hypothetical protein
MSAQLSAAHLHLCSHTRLLITVLHRYKDSECNAEAQSDDLAYPFTLVSLSDDWWEKHGNRTESGYGQKTKKKRV